MCATKVSKTSTPKSKFCFLWNGILRIIRTSTIVGNTPWSLMESQRSTDSFDFEPKYSLLKMKCWYVPIYTKFSSTKKWDGVEYCWSSHQFNQVNIINDLQTTLPAFVEKYKRQAQKKYQTLFANTAERMITLRTCNAVLYVVLPSRAMSARYLNASWLLTEAGCSRRECRDYLFKLNTLY